MAIQSMHGDWTLVHALLLRKHRQLFAIAVYFMFWCLCHCITVIFGTMALSTVQLPWGTLLCFRFVLPCPRPAPMLLTCACRSQIMLQSSQDAAEKHKYSEVSNEASDRYAKLGTTLPPAPRSQTIHPVGHCVPG
jgi:hypothetical protein